VPLGQDSLAKVMIVVGLPDLVKDFVSSCLLWPGTLLINSGSNLRSICLIPMLKLMEIDEKLNIRAKCNFLFLGNI
jgi:hypothetical protein